MEYKRYIRDCGKKLAQFDAELMMTSHAKTGTLMVMFDDEPIKQTTSEFPRNLETMSVDEIQSYIIDLKAEITRAEADIAKKENSKAAADSFFK